MTNEGISIPAAIMRGIVIGDTIVELLVRPTDSFLIRCLTLNGALLAGDGQGQVAFSINGVYILVLTTPLAVGIYNNVAFQDLYIPVVGGDLLKIQTLQIAGDGSATLEYSWTVSGDALPQLPWYPGG